MQMLTDCKGGMFIGPCNAILGDEEELIQGVGGLALQEGAAVGPQAADAVLYCLASAFPMIF